MTTTAFAAPARFRPAAPIPHKTKLPLWRFMTGELRRNVMLGFDESAYEAPVISQNLLTVRHHIVSDPEAVGRVLLDNVGAYGKPDLLKALAGDLLGDGLFAADGGNWRSQRRIMAPAFTPGAVAGFMPVFLAQARATAETWGQVAPFTTDAAADATATTLRIIGRTLYSAEAVMTSDEASDHIAAVLASVAEFRLGAILGLPWLDASPRLRRAAAGQAFLKDQLTGFVAQRRNAESPPDDFLSRMLAAFARENTPDRAADLALYNAITFLVAGHETTANALAWTLYILSEQPQIQDILAAEARDALTETDPQTILTYLPYLRWVLDEVLRLYPPATRIERQATQDDELCGQEIRKGDLVAIWPWLVHRRRGVWSDPDVFDPENFSPESKAAHHRFQYIPFGAGPRVCIGAQFALAEALLILAVWLSRFRFSPHPGHQVEIQGDLALRPKGGLPLRIEPRTD